MSAKFGLQMMPWELERPTDCANGGINSTHLFLNLAISPAPANPELSPRRTASLLRQPLLLTVKVTTEGRPYLGAALGTEEYVQAFVSDKVRQLTGELEQLVTITHSQPHAAHATFTHGMTGKWTYPTRTMPDVGPSLSPLEGPSEPN